MSNDSNAWTGDTYPEPLRIAYIITGIFYFLFGVSGNMLIIVCILKVKSLRNYSNVFVVNIAATDVCLSGYILPISLVDLIQGSYPTPGMCAFNAALYRILNMVSIACKMLVAVNRFYKICRPAIYQHIFRKKTVILMCTSVWLVAGVSVGIVWFGLFSLEYDSQIHLCRVLAINKTRVSIAYFCYSSLAIGTALFCYGKIYKKVKMSVDVLTSTYPQIPPRRFCRNAIDSVRTNCIIFIVYLIVITPDMYLTNFAVRNVVIRGIAANLRFAATGISFVMYGALNKSISKTYKELLCRTQCVCEDKTIAGLVCNETASRNIRNAGIFQISPVLQRNDLNVPAGNSI